MFSPAALALSKLATEQEDLLLSFCFILIIPMIKPQLNNEAFFYLLLQNSWGFTSFELSRFQMWPSKLCLA